MVVSEKTKEWSAGYVSTTPLAESSFSRPGVPKIETGKQSVLLVGRTSQQNSGAAVQLGRQSYLDRMKSGDQRSARLSTSRMTVIEFPPLDSPQPWRHY